MQLKTILVKSNADKDDVQVTKAATTRAVCSKQAFLIDARGMLSPKQAFHLAQRDVPEKWMMGLSASYLRVMQQSIPLSLSLGQRRL